MLNVSTLSQRDKKIRNTILIKSNINTTYFSKTLERLEYRGPNKEAFEKKANGQRKLGWGPNKETFEKKANGQRKLGWGPNKEAFEKKANKQRELGWPQQREFRQEIPQAQQVGWLKRFY